MSFLFRATICSLASSWGIIYNCAGPGCSSLKSAPIQGLFCTSDGTTLWCSNQQSCNGANFTNDIQITIKNGLVVNENYIVANRIQLTNTISTQLPQSTLTSSLQSTKAKTLKATDSFASKQPTSLPMPTSSSTESSQTISHTTSHLQPRALNTGSADFSKLPRLGKRAKINYEQLFHALGEIPKLAEARALANIDIAYGVVKDPQGITDSIATTAKTLGIAIQGALLPPITNIELDLAENRYEDAAADTVKFVLESSVDAAIAAATVETGGLTLPFLLFNHIYISVVVDQVFDEFDELLGAETPTPSAPVPTPTPNPSSAPKPSPTPAPTSAPYNSTLIVRSYRIKGRPKA